MNVIISASAIALFLVYLSTRGVFKYGLELGFAIITFISAIQCHYGNDYDAYLLHYYDAMNSTNLRELVFEGGVVSREFGWMLLLRFFSIFGGDYGFYLFVAALSIVQNAAIYFMISRYLTRNWYFFAFFIYLFNSQFFLISLTTFSQSLCMSIFILIIPWILERKVFRSVLVVLLCTSIHTSAIILIPIVFLGYLPVKYTKLYTIIFVFIFGVLSLFPTYVNAILMFFFSFEDISVYYDRFRLSDNYVNRNIIGLIVSYIPFAVSIYSLFVERSDTNKKIILLACFGFLIIPFNNVIPMAFRLAYYFNIFSICALPLALRNTNKLFRTSVIIFLGYSYIRGYIDFFSPGSVWRDAFIEFHSVFEFI